MRLRDESARKVKPSFARDGDYEEDLKIDIFGCQLEGISGLYKGPALSRIIQVLSLHLEFCGLKRPEEFAVRFLRVIVLSACSQNDSLPSRCVLERSRWYNERTLVSDQFPAVTFHRKKSCTDRPGNQSRDIARVSILI